MVRDASLRDAPHHEVQSNVLLNLVTAIAIAISIRPTSATAS
jgi:hypothetical protein